MTGLLFNSTDSQERTTLFADVVLPVPIPNFFTYRIPFDLNDQVQIGARVVVQFGSKKILTGIIGKLHENAPTVYEARYILELLDDRSILAPQQLSFFSWIAEYYMCTIGEVYNMALPSGLKLSSESRIQLNPSFKADEEEFEFTDQENLVVSTLRNDKTMNYTELGSLLQTSNLNPILKSLIKKNTILIFEEVKERYKPKIEKRIKLHQRFILDKSKLESLFSELEKSPKQLDIVLKYLQKVPVYQNPKLNEKGILKNAVEQAGLSTSSLNTLIKKTVFEEFEITISRFEPVEETLSIPELTEDQEAAYNDILEKFETKETVLLHGITGSGKTNIYLKLIHNAIESGSQVLYLLPEIALTTQIVSRLAQVFGKRMGVYHSRFSSNERVEVWEGVLNNELDIIVGVRSSIFLPFSHLGLVIVDEEHENSYKQFDPAPRYHARDLALVLARHHQAKTLLGSATPSIESFFNAKNEKYGLVQLFKRFGEAQLPHFKLVDLKAEKKKRLMQGDVSSVLMEHLGTNLKSKEQSIVFQNRRGYAPYLNCEECAWIPKCINCAVSLTYHQFNHELRCHYCGYREKPPGSCPACGSTKIKTVGFGTEKLEEDLKALLPEARIQRMDLDTTRKKYSYQSIIEEFEKGSIDILVGTQMISKGLDFEKVSLVGIFDVDRIIHFPDFRSYERAFQLITQVSGRAGRRDKTGTVVIQTSNPQQEVLKDIISNNYENLYYKEINERLRFLYPPFVRLIKLVIKNENKELAFKTAYALKEALQNQMDHQVLGPQEPLISKIRNKYLVAVLIKIERNKGSLSNVKNLIKQVTEATLKDKILRSSRVIFDVDPY